MPVSSFKESARVLDQKRLGSQRQEGYGILRGITRNPTSLQKPPMWRMWVGSHDALVVYMLCVTQEWRSRGYKDTVQDKVLAHASEHPELFTLDEQTYRKIAESEQYNAIKMPLWWDSSRFHESHRMKLLWKKPEWYSQYWADPVPEEEPSYVWPHPTKYVRES